MHQKPNNDQIELTLFGPGFGESIVIHCGMGQWMIVDSCRVGRGVPSALKYLESIGVDLERDVRYILATHWHDDHTKGLFEIVQRCSAAKFVCAGILLKEEFLTLLDLQNDDKMFASDTSEFDSIIRYFHSNGMLKDIKNYPIRFASPNRKIWSRNGNGKTEPSCEVVSLSPSDMAASNWIQSLKALIVPNQKIRKRIMPPKSNQISVALSVKVGVTSVILSADLEEDKNKSGGWQVIVDSDERPQEKAAVNKVSHHGSVNGHCDAVWTNMLEVDPIALVTPYNKGTKLPSSTDVERITKLTRNAYITSGLENRSIRGKTGAVDRTINEVAKGIRVIGAEEGYIRLRKSAMDSKSLWNIERFGSARELCDLYKAA